MNILIDNIPIFSEKKEKALEYIRGYYSKSNIKIASGQKSGVPPFIIYSGNAEILTYAHEHPEFRAIMEKADMTLPDGMMIVWASALLYGKRQAGTGKVVAERIAGADLMDDLCLFASKDRLRIGLIGGFENLAVDTLECLKIKYPGLDGWAIPGPQIQLEAEKPDHTVSSTLNRPKFTNKNTISYKVDITDPTWQDFWDIFEAKPAQLIFFAFGNPRQEMIIESIRQHLRQMGYQKPVVLMAVGGTFDYIAGKIPRAPLWMRQHGLEWLFRLCRQPWRIKRQTALVRFLYHLLLEWRRGL